MTRPTDFEGLLRTLLAGRVEFVLVGGLAATVHGSARSPIDLDIVYRRSPDNIARLVAALTPLAPYGRGAPPGLPFHFDVGTVERGLSFTLDTTLGALNVFGEIAGGGRYEDLLLKSDVIPLFGFECRCATLETLVGLKRAAGRPRDLEALAELEALLERRRDSA